LECADATHRGGSAEAGSGVEDHVDLALGLGTVLHMLGHCVETAFDGSSAIEKVRVFRPHAVVCDLGLPKMDGFEVARILRVDPRLGSVRLIALSAQDRVDDAIAAGFDHYIRKPANLRELARLLAD